MADMTRRVRPIMLEELEIRNLALSVPGIDAPVGGMTVITGETGVIIHAAQ